MNTKSVLKKLKLDKNGFLKIQQAVKNAESKTSGEIAICLTPQSSDYSFWELFASVIVSVFLCLLTIPFSSEIKMFYENRNWISPEWYLPFTFCSIFIIGIFVFFLLFNIPALDRIIVPNSYKNKMVLKNSFEAFSRTGVYCTKKHNGILIFVSYLEHSVKIIADKGISEKISDDLWKIVADELALNIKNNEGCEAFCSAIEKCGELLSEKFPIQKDDVNELPDGLIIVEN